MNDLKELEIVDLGDASEATMGPPAGPQLESDPEYPTRP